MRFPFENFLGHLDLALLRPDTAERRRHDHHQVQHLIERAGDVALKERRPLILVPREAPFSEVHLENMLKLTRMGAIIMPASPGFYHKPQSVEDLVDFIVARILDHLNLPQDLMPRWGEARAEDKRKS